MSQKKHLKGGKETGITLVALVVTIVVLLILAGITITFVLGENGIINMAKRAAEQTNEAVQKEQNDLANSTEQMKNYLNGIGGSSSGDTGSTMKVSDLIGKPADLEKNIDVEDEYGNKITIPAGFTVVPHLVEKSSDKTEEEWNAEKVEYNYREDHKPCVQDGIVVQDSEENQFVWIPVGEIINKDKSKTTIDLARYKFNNDGTIANIVTDGNELKTNSVLSYGYLEELASSTTYANSKAKDIEGFKDSSKLKGGYYLARYEASQNGENPMNKANQAVWNNITQPNASSVAQKMYTSSYYESDLLNSYSWDTALVFIQTYGGEANKAYSQQNSKNTSLTKTGVSGDKVCNIYDMASNAREWTTETCTNTEYICTSRGGSFTSAGYSAWGRAGRNTTDKEDAFSFRTILYIN